jgi:hypothetical protein
VRQRERGAHGGLQRVLRGDAPAFQRGKVQHERLRQRAPCADRGVAQRNRRKCAHLLA